MTQTPYLRSCLVLRTQSKRCEEAFPWGLSCVSWASGCSVTRHPGSNDRRAWVSLSFPFSFLLPFFFICISPSHTHTHTCTHTHTPHYIQAGLVTCSFIYWKCHSLARYHRSANRSKSSPDTCYAKSSSPNVIIS